MNSAALQGRRCRGAARHAQLRRGTLPALVRAHAVPEQHQDASAPGPSHLSHHVAPAAPLPLEPEPAPLRISRRIAAARAVESRRHQAGSSSSSSSSSDSTGSSSSGEAPLFVDPYAELLAAGRAPAGSSPSQVASDLIATAYTDELLLRAVGLTAVNGISDGDYRQVVLLGDALDSRPYRLPWPPGTALYLVAPREAHAAAEAALASEAAAAIAAAVAAATTVSPPTSTSSSVSSDSTGPATTTTSTAAYVDADADAAASAPAASGAKAKAGVRVAKRPAGPRPPPGCLLRRVCVDLRPVAGGGAPDLLGPLTAAGFRGDRLSVWGLQGIAGLELDQQDVAALLAEAANAAAYHSLLLGELPGELGAAQAANAIAEAGLLGAPLAVGTEDTSYGRWQAEWGPPEDPEQPQRWLFASQQVRLSIAQMDTYDDHGAAAAELDEDFFDNFS